jgi:hypothetical protein
MTRFNLCASGLALAFILAACGGDDLPEIDDDPGEPPGCPAGSHDGGDGACFPTGTCAPGYRLTDAVQDICSLIEPGTIRYAGPSGPVAGVTVLFHDAGGALLDRGETDDAGELTSLLPLTAESGLVTLIVPDADLTEGSGAPTLLTEPLWPWESHTFGSPPAMAEPTGELVITLPGAVAGASTYVVDAGLVESAGLVDPAQPVVLVLPESDLASPPPVVATALDAEGVPVAWTAALYPRGTAVTLDPWSDAFTDVEVAVYNPPPDASGFGYFAAVIAGREYAMGQRIDIPPVATPDSEPPAPIVHRIAPVVDRLALVAGFEQPAVTRGIFADPSWYLGYESDDEAEPLPPLLVDLSADLLPRVDSIGIEHPDPRAPGRPTISWSAEGLSWRSAIVALGYSGATRSEIWSITAAGTGITAVGVPELPSDLADRAPTDTTDAQVDISLVEGYGGTELWDLYGPDHAAEQASPGAIRHIPPPDPRLLVTSTRR